MDEIKRLEELDPTFTESGFISKVDNTYIMILSSIMDGNMKPVQHKLSDKLYNKYYEKVKKLKENNEIQLYDELNVKSTSIISVEITDEQFIIKVSLISRYMDYTIDSTTKKYKYGNNDHRIEKKNHLVFIKSRSATDEGIVRKCSYCGAPVDVNKNGICIYCKKPYDTQAHDWVLYDCY